MPAHDVHGLRKLVSAMDKNLAVQKPFDEAVKYIRERYKTDADSAREYVMYLRGVKDPEGRPTKSNPVDRRHTRFDEATGKWVQVPDPDEQAGVET